MSEPGTEHGRNVNEVVQQNAQVNRKPNVKNDPVSVSQSTQQNLEKEFSQKELSPVSSSSTKISDEDIAFNWESVGHYQDASSPAPVNKLDPTKLKLIESYIMDHFYSDWYWNCSLVIGTCFFSWLVARLGGGIFSLGFVFLCTNSVYRSEFRRFNRNIRDDLTRVVSTNRLENDLETMEWLNSFLAKFWVIYMPALSETVMTEAKKVLDGAAPGYGIDALSLDEFTLGTKSPTINSVKSYTKKGKDHVEMDWDFSFTPNDTGNMTQNELRKIIKPKVALGVRVGKSVVSKRLPILVENMSFSGRMNIKLKLFNNFPHIKMVSVSFLEPPTIDYALKPVGGDTFGLDIMSLIPGLSSFVNSLIHSNLRPMFYAPNSFDIDVEQMMAQQLSDSIGVVAVTVKSCSTLKPSTLKKTVDPYVTFTVDNNPEIDERTTTKSDINDPIFNETKYILVNSLQQNLNIHVFDYNELTKDTLIGNTIFHLNDLIQDEVHLNNSGSLTDSGKTKGKIDYDIRYFPVLPPNVLDDGTEEVDQDSEVGILKFSLHSAKNLDLSHSLIGALNPYAKIFINKKLVKHTRTLKRVNEPSWEETFETLITEQSNTEVNIQIYDSVGIQIDPLIGEFKGNLQDIIFSMSQNEDWFDCINEGQVRLTAQWKAVGLTGISSMTQYTPSIGAVRLHIRGAEGLKNLEAIGKVDPYVRVLLNGKLKTRTLVHPKTMSPEFEEVFFIPIVNEHQHLSLEIMDKENRGKDRSLGNLVVSIKQYLKKNQENYYIAYDGASEIIKKPVLYKGKEKGTLSYSVSFIPTIPVYTKAELQEVERKKEIDAKEEVKRQEEQAMLEELYKQHPNDYEWVEDVEKVTTAVKKEFIALADLLHYKSGNLVIHLLDGDVAKPDTYVHFLFDSFSFPSFVSSKTQGRKLGISETGEGFVRDLPNSKLTVRLSKKQFASDDDDIIAEQSFSTLTLLQESFDEPISLKVDASVVKLQFEYIPTAVTLNPLDTVLDVGHIKLDILDADNLIASDRNGKSDPYAVITLNGSKIYKTQKIKKTLSPTWNEEVDFPILSRSRQKVHVEVYDWDMANDDDFLGKALIDLSKLEPLKETPFQLNLDSQGTVRFKAVFKPEYVRPKIDPDGDLNLSSVSGVPLKVVSGAASFATTGVGAGMSKGGSLFKSVVGRRKPKNGVSYNDNESLFTVDSNRDFNSTSNSTGQYTNDLQSLRSGRVNGPGSNAIVGGSDFLSAPSPRQHRRAVSDASDMSSFVGSVNTVGAIQGKVTIVSGSGFVPTQLFVKISLNSTSRGKDIYKTKPLKSSDRFFKWNETVSFKATPDTQMIFSIREHHTFGKSSEIAEGKVDLGEVLGNPDDMLVDVEGKGSLIVNFKYFPLDQ